jgi:hypothetical protein
VVAEQSGMMFAIRQGIVEYMREHGYPVAVDIGHDRPASRGAARHRGRIVLDRDPDGSETIGEPPGVRINPRRVAARMIAYRATIYATETKQGSMLWEHYAELDRYVDALVCALRDWCTAQKSLAPEFTGARVLTAEELGGAEALHAVGYELKFRVGRSVDRRDYDGSAEPTADISEITTSTRVSLDGDTFEEIE